MAPIWEIVGGTGEGGGVVVRQGPEMRSPLVAELLRKGAEVEEVEMLGERLHYRKLEGTGPDEGWVSISFGGKELASPQKPPRNPPPTEVGLKGESPLPAALFFPGQGSQYVKMLDGVKDIPAVQDMLEKAQKILGWDVLELCEEGPEEKLEMTKFCQPAMFIGGLAGVEKLRGENEEAVTRASAMAGFSLGEYTALCAAGVMEFEVALKLVKLRGEAMHEAAEIGRQKMLSVVGLEQDKLEQLCKDAARKSGAGSVCQIAICLFPNGFSVGGSEKAIKMLQEMCEKAGAAQARIVKTSGAFHTQLMQPALEKLSVALDEALPKMKSPLHSVWMNACAEPMRPGAEPQDIVAHLKRQLTKPVLWEQSVTEMIKDDEITDFYECGPSKQLKAMMKRIDPNAWKTMESVEIGFKPRKPLPKEVGPNGESPLPAAIVFAGQGSQYVGMMDGVKDLPSTKEMFEKARETLGYDLYAICQEGPEEKLTETQYCQPAMFIGGLAGLERLRQENEEICTRASCMAGFSLGEYTALCAAGVFTFEDGLKLVSLRGKAMQEAAEIGKQSMVSVVGLTKDKLEPLCKEAAKKAGPDGVCQIAISLFAEGFTVGGTEKACTILKDLAEKKAGAQQCRMLKAQGAFHTPLMQPAAEKLAEALEETLPKMKSPMHMVYMNASAEAVRPGDDPKVILDLLKRQLTNPVLWDSSMKEIIEDKVVDFYEVGPSRQLKAMMKRIDATVWKTMENIEIGSKPRPPPPTTVGPNDESPLPVVICFPGQGSQYPGMLYAVKDKPAV
jgi:[acyl-carrier-protein] S-malonyltransferase